jgi:hypothetical protein
MSQAYEAVQRVRDWFPESPMTQRECEMLLADAKAKLELGWSFEDTVTFLCCNECVNPELAEDKALKAMRRLTEKYSSVGDESGHHYRFGGDL